MEAIHPKVQSGISTGELGCGMHAVSFLMLTSYGGWGVVFRCKSILEKLDGRARLVLHGTHGVKDDLFLECVKLGFTKINLNKSIRERYTEFLEEKAGRMELTKQIEQGIDVYSKEIERYMDLFGSSGKQYLVNK
jgi:hypothetical protein